MSRDVKAPCERCGVVQSAQFCWDCRLVDPEMTAGGRNSRQQQTYLRDSNMQKGERDFWSWLYRWSRCH